MVLFLAGEMVGFIPLPTLRSLNRRVEFGIRIR